MLRRVDYRIAINLFVFTALWFFIGAIVLWSPLPGALGIGSGLFVMWVLLFFGVLAVAGGALTLAALNVAFPDAGSAAATDALRESTIERAKSAVPRVAPAPESSAAQAQTISPPDDKSPIWAPAQTDAPTPENIASPPLETPPPAGRPQRGDA